MSKVRKVIAAVLVLCLMFSCFTATAASKAITYDSKTSDYTATKISHPTKGPGEIDGIVDWESGDADRGQSYAWSAVGDGDYVYVGTCYAAIWTTIKYVGQINPNMGLTVEKARAAANAAFNGKLYTGDAKNNPTDANRAVILKINTKTGDVKIVYDVRSTPGEKMNRTYSGFRAAIKFNGKLYFCNTRLRPQIIEIDPKTDATKVVYTCEKIDYSKEENKAMSTGIRGIAVYNNMLVVSAIREGGAYIVASKDPSKGQESFKTVGTQQDLLNYPAYMYNDGIFGGSVFDMVSFNGKLYITVVAGRFDYATNTLPNKGFALFEAEEKDGKWTYKLIVGDPKDGAKYPFGFGGDRAGAANMVVHDGYLYVGGYNDPMIAVPNAMLKMDFEKLYKDLSDPVNLWRLDAKGNWELVVGETNDIFPERVGNMGEGFDNPMNQYVWRMQSFDGKLYVGTFDVTGLVRPLAQFCNKDILKNTPKEWASQIKYIVDLVKMLKKAPEAKAVNAATIADAAELVDTMKDIKSLLNKGGADDIKSTEQLHKLMTKAVKLYEKIRPVLPEIVTAKLDKVLNQETADRIFYFIGSCKYLSKSQEGFDLLVSADGVNFEAISRDGLGDKFNHGVRTFAVNDHGIYLGTANPFFGTQVWHIESKNDAPVAPDADKDDDTVAPETDAPATETPKDEAPDTGVDTTSIAIAASAMAAGVVLAIIARKKKVTD